MYIWGKNFQAEGIVRQGFMAGTCLKCLGMSFGAGMLCVKPRAEEMWAEGYSKGQNADGVGPCRSGKALGIGWGTLEDFVQRSDLISLTLWKGRSDCCTQIRHTTHSFQERKVLYKT